MQKHIKRRKTNKTRAREGEREKRKQYAAALANKGRMLAFPEETGRTRGDFEHTLVFFSFLSFFFFLPGVASSAASKRNKRVVAGVRGTSIYPPFCRAA